MSDSCIFCDIICGNAPGEILMRFGTSNYEAAIALKPRDPVTEGHVLVIPKDHVDSAHNNPNLTGEIFALAVRYAREAGLASYNLITSVGAAATQTVHHLHVHVVPRHEDDGLHLPWTEQVPAAVQSDREKARSIDLGSWVVKTPVPVSAPSAQQCTVVDCARLKQEMWW